MDLAELFSLMPSLVELISNAFYTFICFFLASFVWKGWKGYKNWGLNVLMIIVLAFFIAYGSIFVSSIIPLRIPYFPYGANALLISVLLYISLKLLSGKTEEFPSSIRKLRKELNNLKQRFDNLMSYLESKNLLPKPLSQSKLENSLKEILLEKKIKDYKIKSQKSYKSEEVFTIISKGKKIKISLNPYSGELISYEVIKGNFPTRQFVAVSLLCFVGLLVILGINDSSLSEARSLISLGEFIPYEISNQSCPTLNDTLYFLKSEGYETYENESGLYFVSEHATLYVNSSLSFEEILTSVAQELISNPNSFLDFNICSINDVKNSFYLCSIKDGNTCECEKLKNAENYCSFISQYLIKKIVKTFGR